MLYTKFMVYCCLTNLWFNVEHQVYGIMISIKFGCGKIWIRMSILTSLHDTSLNCKCSFSPCTSHPPPPPPPPPPTHTHKKKKKRRITKIVLEKNKHKIHVRNTRWDITTSFVLIAMSLLLVQSIYSV